MKLKRGDVALVFFPQSDLNTFKLRPVLIVQANDLRTEIPQLVVAMISSNPRRVGHPSRVSLVLGSEEARRSGLRTDSVIMTDNLVTVELYLFQRRLGS